MHTLLVNCNQCKTATSFPWCFNNDVVVSAESCKKCSESFQLIQPKQKTENIITDPDFLPYPYDGFYYESNGQFHYYQIPIKEVSVPILFLTKTVDYKLRDGRKFEKNEDGLVKLSDLETFVNEYVFK